MKRMLAYIRRSKESDDRTLSIIHQRTEIDGYNLRNELITASTIIDNGVSGGDRSRITHIRVAITQGNLEGMVAYHLDRIARDAAAQLDLLSWFQKRGLEMHTVNMGLIHSEQSHEFLNIGVQSMMNEYHRRRCVEHGVETYRKQRIGNRRYSRYCPYGYQFTEENNIVENSKEQITFQIINFYTLEEPKSANALSRDLNLSRSFNRIGTPWSAGSIARIQKRIRNANNR